MAKKKQVPNFFLSGICKDPGYRNIRDNPQNAQYRNFVEDLWRKYEPYADRHFLTDARDHFLQRFWEMYVCATFLCHGFSVNKKSNEGPEFYVQIAGHRVWIEAIAPNPGDGPDYVSEPPYGEAFDVPSEKIILRYTSALLDKLRKYKEFCKKGMLLDTDRYVVAINSRGIPHAPYGSALPYHVHAFLPFGNRTVSIDPKSSKITDSFLQYRDRVIKLNGKTVSTQPFLDSGYAGISAVIHSAVDCANGPSELGADFDVLHNPLAKCALPTGSLPWCRHRTYSNGTLETVEHGRLG